MANEAAAVRAAEQRAKEQRARDERAAAERAERQRLNEKAAAKLQAELTAGQQLGAAPRAGEVVQPAMAAMAAMAAASAAKPAIAPPAVSADPSSDAPQPMPESLPAVESWPPALQSWVERSFIACQSHSQRQAVANDARARIELTKRAGTLHTADWAITPLASLYERVVPSYIAPVRQPPLHAAAKHPHAQSAGASSSRDPCVCTVCSKRLKTPTGMLDHRLAVHKVPKHV